MYRVVCLALLFSGAAGSDLFAQSAAIQSLGYLNPNSPSSVASGVSPDGKTVVGVSTSASTNTPSHAFRWTATDGIQDLGAFDDASNDSAAFAVSPTGVIVGSSYTDGDQNRGFRVAAFGGLQDLSGLGDSTFTYDISDNAALLVGQSLNQNFLQRAVRWTGAGAGTIEDLGTIGNFVGESGAFECSADGSVIVGLAWNGSNIHACLYRQGQPALDLGSLAGSAGYSTAYGITANGAFVVGFSETASGNIHAIYWKAATGMKDLGTVDGVTGTSSANAVSSDGRRIVGSSANNSRPGGRAAVWIDNKPRQLWDLLVNDYEANVIGWTSFDNVSDVSRDGSVLVGNGVYQGATTAFRITLTPNKVPSVAAPTPVSVECTGGLNRVVLSAKVSDGDATDRLTVIWGVGGVARQTTSNIVPGSNVTFSFSYKDGETPVWIGVNDGKASSSATTKVTVVDTKSPIILVADDVRVKVDRGEVFASGVKLKTPSVNDVCDPKPKVTSNAKAKYPIGTTKVTWTVRDKSGNIAKAIQRVIVKNDPPVANAGSNVTQTTSASSVTLKLNGSLSKDANGHKLKYLWKALGVKFSSPTSVRPTASFPVGRTQVTLTVTDEAGAKSTDLMTVNIRAARNARTAATLADSSVREAQLNALDAHARGRSDALNTTGLSLATSAFALGTLAGDDVGADEDAPVSQADLTSYLTHRAQAAQQARMAGERFYESFLVSGDGNALTASMYAYYGSGLSIADLSSSDVHEALVEESRQPYPAYEP